VLPYVAVPFANMVATPESLYSEIFETQENVFFFKTWELFR